MSLIYKIEAMPTGVQIFFFEGKILSDDYFETTVQTIQDKINHSTTQFVFELSKLEHINSNGLNLFLKLFSKIRSKGGELVFCNLSTGVEKLFAISKLDSIFNICDSTNEALNYLNAQQA